MSIGSRFLKMLDKRADEFGAQMVTFGIFGVINYPLFYILWPHLAPHDYTNFYIRMIATVLCVPLTFKDYWSPRLKPYRTLYWYFALTYCLPFFATFMLLKNFTSPSWLTNVMVAIFILIMLVDWVSAVILVFLGVLGGCFVYHYTMNPHYYPLNDYFGPIANYLFAMVIGVVFSRNKEKIQREKLRAMSAIGGRIAHELRTPLMSIKARATGGERYLPKLCEGYQMARDAGLKVTEIRQDRYELLPVLMTDITEEVNYANTVIDMLLMNVKGREQPVLTVTQGSHSIVESVSEALRRYPFVDDAERAKVQLNTANDFDFTGSRILFVHVIFNLLKNALYFVTKNNRGSIDIWLEKTSRGHELHFRDTAQGIAPEELSSLFELFHTTTPNGTGIGLSFCRTAMVSFGGNIYCHSNYGKYTEFVLLFP